MTDQPEALRVAHELECRALINEISLDDDFVMELDAARLLREQHAEIERLRADAERYRWLRDWKEGTHDIVPMTGRYCDTPILRDELDLAIDAAALDAAMAEERKP